MDYESAWLNDSIPALAGDISGIDGIYLLPAESDGRPRKGIINTALDELKNMSSVLFGSCPKTGETISEETLYSINSECANIALKWTNDNKKNGSFTIRSDKKQNLIYIEADSEEGFLYGAFELRTQLKTRKSLKDLEMSREPAAPLRMLDHWDNMDGSIERGYSGNSFFFKNGRILVDDRTRAYARLIASVGINACVINNVNVKNAATRLITSEYRSDLKKLASIFGDYGIALYLSLNFAAPIELGGLSTCDPCDGEVIAWWKDTLDSLFTDMPNLGGFLIKADSEGRPGPFTYGRTHADGANMLAEILEPYGAKVIWRCFVYNCRQDWRDTVTDRARAQYDNFMPLDGQFKDNVILQIKNGPMDFQVREPVSPLFGGLKDTNEMIEFQIAQEYTGQQKHVCYLIPEFREILDSRTYIRDREGQALADDTVGDLVTGRTFGNINCGMAAVSNTGDDPNWTGHDLAAANLYGFGRLAFDPSLSPEEISREWIMLTFGTDDLVFHKINHILLTSRPVYEKYTAPLGVGWMVNPGHHYGPNVDGYEHSEWGTYHRADAKGIGVERGSRGTGYIGQYNEPLKDEYENLETCPDELLLFMHHVPYTYRLHSGKTVIQHIYDSHFEGAEEAEGLRREWTELKDRIPEKIYARTLDRFNLQTESAAEWRDHINGYFREKSSIPDEKGRI